MEAKRSYVPRMETEVLKKARGESDVERFWTKQEWGQRVLQRVGFMWYLLLRTVTDFTKVGDSRGSPED